MNEDLILRSLKWIIENTETKRQDVDYNSKDSILIDIDMILNPIKEKGLDEKTAEIFAEQKKSE